MAGDGTAWHTCAMRLLACACISYYIYNVYLCCVWGKWPRGWCNELFSPFQRDRPALDTPTINIGTGTGNGANRLVLLGSIGLCKL